jgi:hypothetical protein
VAGSSERMLGGMKMEGFSLKALLVGREEMGASGTGRGISLPIIISFVVESIANGVIEPLP